jgi:hypothetical protein
VNCHFELLSSTPFLSQVINGESAKKGRKEKNISFKIVEL